MLAVNKFIGASALVFVVACCLPALEFKNSSAQNDIMLGLRALAIGWSGFFAGILSWYANPLWLVAIVFSLMRKPTLSLCFGALAVIVAFTTFKILGRELPADEGNVTKMTVIKILPGCYVWLASLAITPLGALMQRLGWIR